MFPPPSDYSFSPLVQVFVYQNIDYPYIDVYIHEDNLQFNSLLYKKQQISVLWIGCVVIIRYHCFLNYFLGTQQYDRWNNTWHLPGWNNPLYIFRFYICCKSAHNITWYSYQLLPHKKHHSPQERILFFIYHLICR